MTLITPKPVRGRNLSVLVKRPGERRNLSRSATRALDALEFFGEAKRPLRAVDIARSLAIHASTTNQLLKTIVDSLQLMFDARNKTYLPTPRLAAFSYWLTTTYGQGGDVTALLENLHRQTGMIVTVSTSNDLFMQVIEIVASENGGERGMRISLFGSAIGSAYLSMLDDVGVRRLADRARIPVAQLPEIFEGVARIRCDGFAEGAGAGETFWSIALPLPIRGMHVPTVLGLAGPADEVRARVPEFLPIIREAIDHWVR